MKRYPAYRDTGVEWLGEVPEGWVICGTGRKANVLSGYAFPSNGFSLDENDTPLLRGVNVGVGELRWEDTVYLSCCRFRGHEDKIVTKELESGYDETEVQP